MGGAKVKLPNSPDLAFLNQPIAKQQIKQSHEQTSRTPTASASAVAPIWPKSITATEVNAFSGLNLNLILENT